MPLGAAHCWMVMATKAGVRSAVKAVLRKRGVKPEHLDALTKQVIIQAEAMFSNWPLPVAA